jgi:hypothetical protein
VPLLYFRWLLLAFAGLAILTGVAMHGLVRRLLLQHVIAVSQQWKGVPSRALRIFAVMIDRAWVFRFYHLCFAVVLFAGWWYLGTTDGQVVWTHSIMHQ